MTVQGHPRSLVLLVINSNLGPTLSRFQRYCRFSAENSDLTPIPPEFWGVPLGL